MKILIASDFYIHNLGGVTTSLLALSKGLIDKGHDVRILTPSERFVSYKEGNVYSIRSLPAFYAPDLRFSIFFHEALIEELIQWKPDIIHVQSEGTALSMAERIAKSCGIPFIATCHTDYAFFVFGANRSFPPFVIIEKCIAKRVYRHAFHLLVPAKKALGFPFLQPFKDKISVLPNGIDIHRYRNGLSAEENREMREALGLSEKRKILVCVSRLSKEKNIQELISFFPALKKEIPEAALLIVGDGPRRRQLDNLVTELHLQDDVIFAGRKSLEETIPFYALADLYVSASTFEVHSMSNLEALASGLPFLCRDDEALEGVLEHKANGFLYRNEEEFVRYGSFILRDDKLRKEMGEKSSQKAEDFSCERFAQNALALYEEVLSRFDSKAHTL